MRSLYEARPGRDAVVAASLMDLHGTTPGGAALGARSDVPLPRVNVWPQQP